MEQLKEEKMMAEKSKFEEELEKLNINLTEHQKEQFDRYYEMLVEWNNVMNLTGITDYDEVNLKHFTDSLTLVRNIDMNKIDAVIDIGTGAGFPGLPIKIAFPHIHVVLLDSLKNKILKCSYRRIRSCRRRNTSRKSGRLCEKKGIQRTV